MKRFKSLFILLFLFQFLSRAQYSDSVLKALKEVKEASYFDSLRLYEKGIKAEKVIDQANEKSALAELHLLYGNYFYYVHDLKKAEVLFDTALREAEEYGNTHIETLARIRFCYLDFEKGNTEEAEKNMERLWLTISKTNDAENKAEALNIRGLIKEQKNQTKEAAKLYLEGISIAEAYKLNYYKGVFHNNLGLLKYYSGQNAQALADYETGLMCAELDKNQRLASHIKMNMCVIFVSRKELDKAALLFSEVTEYSRKNNLPLELASVYINLSSSFINIGLYDKALNYIDSGIYVLKKFDLVQSLSKALLSKCEILRLQGNVSQALNLLEEVRSMNKRTGNLEDEANYYFMKYQFDVYKKDNKSALANFLMYSRLKDSANNILNGKTLEELMVKYNVQKKENELEKEKLKSVELEKSNQKEKFMKWTIGGISIGVVIFIILFSSIWYSKKIRENHEQFSRMLIRNLEEERHRIARDLHDDVGQSLSMIKTKVNHSNPDSELKKLEDELSRVIEQTRQIARGLYPSYLEKIGLIRAVASLLEKVQEASGIECSYEMDDKIESESLETKTHIYRILQECVNNTLKHSGANALKISLVQDNSDFKLQYRDNGKGITSQKTFTGIGLQSMAERSKIIGGTISFGDKSEKGFVLNLKFRSHS